MQVAAARRLRLPRLRIHPRTHIVRSRLRACLYLSEPPHPSILRTRMALRMAALDGGGPPLLLLLLRLLLLPLGPLRRQLK